MVYRIAIVTAANWHKDTPARVIEVEARSETVALAKAMAEADGALLMLEADYLPLLADV